MDVAKEIPSAVILYSLYHQQVYKKVLYTEFFERGRGELGQYKVSVLRDWTVQVFNGGRCKVP